MVCIVALLLERLINKYNKSSLREKSVHFLSSVKLRKCLGNVNISRTTKFLRIRTDEATETAHGSAQKIQSSSREQCLLHLRIRFNFIQLNPSFIRIDETETSRICVQKIQSSSP